MRGSASVPAASSDGGWGEPGGGFQQGAPFTMLMHADTPLRLMRGKRLDRESDVHASLDRVDKGQVSATAAVLFVESKYHAQGAEAYCTRAAQAIDRNLEDHAARLRPALSASDFESNWRSGHHSWFRTLEGSWCLAGRVENIDRYHESGVRMIGLTWQGDHAFATSWIDRGTTGLTEIGVRAVKRMNELGIAVDVSHMSDRAVDDVLRVSRAPVFASHSNARALCDHRRNLTDDQIRRIAASGGVMGINFYPAHLRKNGEASLADVVSHIQHIRAVGGLGSVGLGSDFDGILRGPSGLETAAELPSLREALRRAGYSDSEIAAVLGGNFLRAFRVVEERAKRADR